MVTDMDYCLLKSGFANLNGGTLAVKHAAGRSPGIASGDVGLP